MADPEVSIVAYPDGPFIVRGATTFVAPDGTIVTSNRRTVALCRCGASAIKPWCDGTHKLTGFRATPA